MKVGKGIWRVVPGLYVSVVPDVPMLKAHDINAVVSVVKRGAPQDVIEYVGGDNYFQTTIADGAVIYKEQFWQAANWAFNWRMIGQTVLIHCIGGRNRSVLVAALVAMKVYDLTGVEVLAGVRAARPNSISNPVFETWLKEMK